MNAVVCNVCTPDCEMVPLSQSKSSQVPMETGLGHWFAIDWLSPSFRVVCSGLGCSSASRLNLAAMRLSSPDFR